MDIFGLTLQEVIFSIFLPFLFFFLLVYALLRKSRILGEPKEVNALNTLISLVISALGISSIYYLGLSTWLPFIAGFMAVVAFVSLYLFGILGRVKEKMPSYASGEAFKTEDEKKFAKGMKDCEGLWERYQKQKDPEAKKQLYAQLASEVNKLKPLADKLNKSLYDYEWYREATETGEKE